MLPPARFCGEGHTRWREIGWESPNSDEGTYTVVRTLLKKKRPKLRLLDGVGHDRPPPVSHKGTAVVDEERGLQAQALQVRLTSGDDLLNHGRHPEPESSDYPQSISP